MYHFVYVTESVFPELIIAIRVYYDWLLFVWLKVCIQIKKMHECNFGNEGKVPQLA